jgi:uncharacterized protein (DUF58 family)
MGKDKTNKNVFLSLSDLLKMEQKVRGVNFLASQQKSNSILSGKYASRLRGRGLDFEEARPYVIGDDIRNIDWKVTAKTGKTHTKVFTEEKEKPAFIFVDQSPSMGFGSEKKTKAVIAGELASIIAHKIKKSGDRVGGMVYTGSSYDLITPKRDARNIIHFLQKIVDANQYIYEAQAFDFEKSLNDIFAKLHHIITHDFLVFIISDFHRYSDAVVKYISQLSLHNDVILIKVFDHLEEQLPNEKIVVSNISHQINIDGKNKKTRINLSEDFETNYNKFKADLEKHKVTIFKINTSEPVETQLLNVFSNR